MIGFVIEISPPAWARTAWIAYEACFCFELDQAGIAFERQAGIPVVYRNMRLDTGYRAGLIIA